MNHKLVVVLYLCIASVWSAPSQLPFLSMQYGMQPQLPILRQMAPNLQSPSMSPQQQPLVIVLPNAANPTADDRNLNLNEQIANLKSNTGHIDENKDAVIVDAPNTEPRNAVVYLPEEARFTIGQLISYNPFLPIEINVPDKIKFLNLLLTPSQWFKPKGHVPQGDVKTVENRSQLPVIVMPYSGPVPGLNQ